MNPLLQRLRHHVTGAIERGEAVAIKERRHMITTQREARAEFWRQHPNLDRKKIRNYSGNGTMYTTDTRVAFVDWLDYMSKSGQISDAVVRVVTLSGG